MKPPEHSNRPADRSGRQTASGWGWSWMSHPRSRDCGLTNIPPVYMYPSIYTTAELLHYGHPAIALMARKNQTVVGRSTYNRRLLSFGYCFLRFSGNRLELKKSPLVRLPRSSGPTSPIGYRVSGADPATKACQSQHPRSYGKEAAWNLAVRLVLLLQTALQCHVQSAIRA